MKVYEVLKEGNKSDRWRILLLNTISMLEDEGLSFEEIQREIGMTDDEWYELNNVGF